MSIKRPRLRTLRPAIALLPPLLPTIGSINRQRARSEKRAHPFYSTPEWRSLMRTIIVKRGRRCEDPQHDPHDPRENIRLYGDHIHELADGGAPLDPCNILLRCAPCHGRKTAEERKRRHGDRG